MKILIILALSLCISFAICAQENLSLSEAIAIGLENNYQIQIDRKQLEKAKNKNTWAFAGKTPSINLSVMQNNNLNISESPSPFAINGNILNNNLQIGLDAGITLFNGYRVQYNKQQLDGLLTQKESNIRSKLETTIKNIINSYFATVVQKEQVNIFNKLLALSKDRIYRQEVRNEFGQAGKFDLLQIKDAFLSDSSNFITQENLLKIQFRNLNLTMGVDSVTKTYILTETISRPIEKYLFKDLEKQMLEANSSIKLLEISKQLSIINTRIQKTSKSLLIKANTGISTNGSLQTPLSEALKKALGNQVKAGGSLTPYFNFSLTYNLYNGKVNDINIQNAKIDEEIATLNILNSKRNLSSSLRALYDNFNNQLLLLDITESLFSNSEENLRISKERFNAAQINSFDYRAIQLNFINAAQSRLNALYNLKVTETEIHALIGDIIK